MKTNALLRNVMPSCSTVLARAMAIALLIGGCDQTQPEPLDERDGGECISSVEVGDEPTEAETLAYSKQIIVTDGSNEVTLLIASDDETLIERYDADSFELFPVFERSEPAELHDHDHDHTATPVTHDFSHAVLLEERSVRLEQGAIGYGLREVDPGFRHAIQCGAAAANVYSTGFDYISVTVNGPGCTEVQIQSRKWSWSWYDEKAHDLSVCPGETLTAGSGNSDRVRANVCPGPGLTLLFTNSP